MWEAIASNRRRSWILLALMGAVMLGLGGAIGASIDPAAGAVAGVLVAAVIWLVMWLVASVSGDKILLASVGARKIEQEDAPRLFNIVEEMKLAAGLPLMPTVYVIESPSLNAFAVGRNPEKAAVAVTSALMQRLGRDELQGVIAHEIGHIRNLDIRFMTMASIMLGATVMIADGFLRVLRHGRIGGGGRRTSKGGGQAQIAMLALAVVFAILAPLLAQMLYFACSRRREFLADASAARFTRYPEGLASALEKISRRGRPMGEVSRAVAPLFIINPLGGLKAVSLFSTHPPTEDRVQILRSMAGGAGFAAYEAAHRELYGGKKHCIGKRSLSAADAIAIREPTIEADPKGDGAGRARDVANLLDRLGNYLILPCACGVGIKLPPTWKRDSIRCARCGREHDVPAAREESKDDNAVGPLVFRRKGTGWESFRCNCGRHQQISPAMKSGRMTCAKCNREIRIHG